MELMRIFKRQKSVTKPEKEEDSAGCENAEAATNRKFSSGSVPRELRRLRNSFRKKKKSKSELSSTSCESILKQDSENSLIDKRAGSTSRSPNSLNRWSYSPDSTGSSFASGDHVLDYRHTQHYENVQTDSFRSENDIRIRHVRDTSIDSCEDPVYRSNQSYSRYYDKRKSSAHQYKDRSPALQENKFNERNGNYPANNVNGSINEENDTADNAYEDVSTGTSKPIEAFLYPRKKVSGLQPHATLFERQANVTLDEMERVDETNRPPENVCVNFTSITQTKLGCSSINENLKQNSH